MDLDSLDRNKKEYDIPLDEDFPDKPGGMSPKKKRRLRWLLLIPAVIAAAVLLTVALNFNAIAVTASPAYALRRGARMVKPVTNPVICGALGEITVGDKSANCAGTVRAQVADDGLRVLVSDMSLSGELVTLDFSGYLSPHEAAVIAPGLTEGSQAWYGVSLDEPIRDQTAGTGGDPDYGWYYNEANIKAFQYAADEVKELLAGVTDMGLSQKEKDALATFVKAVKLRARKGSGVWFLEGTASEADCKTLLGAFGLNSTYADGDGELRFTLDRKTGVLTGVSAANGRVTLDLDLGSDPQEELAPRLELTVRKADGSVRWSTALAMTVSFGGTLEPPRYTNAFKLLPYVENPVMPEG